MSTVSLSLDKLQHVILNAVLASTAVNHILFIVDNVQENPLELQGIVQPHKFLRTLDEAMSVPNLRRQRRRHIVALYTDESTNQSSSPAEGIAAHQIEFWFEAQSERTTWSHYPLPAPTRDNLVDLLRWVEKAIQPPMPSKLEQVKRVVELDSRRLTVQLSVLLLPIATDVELAPIQEVVQTVQTLKKTARAGHLQASTNADLLIPLVSLSLSKLKEAGQHLFSFAAIASCLHFTSVSVAVFMLIRDLTPGNENQITPEKKTRLSLDLVRLCAHRVLKK